MEYRKQGSDAWLVFADGVSKSTKATVTKLAKETTYEFRVAAVNSAGQGGYSSTATYKTEKD